MGLHSGTSHERDGNYFGPEVNLAARVMAAAWGGQVLCTDVVARAQPAIDASLGPHSLRDVPEPVTLHQLLEPDAADRLPASSHPRHHAVDPALPAVDLRRSSGRRRCGPPAAPRPPAGHAHRARAARARPGWPSRSPGREGPRRPGGTYFADLAALDDGEHVAAAVGRACLVPPDAGRTPADQLVEALADQSALVVLDNCEHVLDAAADLADRVLGRCPGGRRAGHQP